MECAHLHATYDTIDIPIASLFVCFFPPALSGKPLPKTVWTKVARVTRIFFFFLESFNKPTQNKKLARHTPTLDYSAMCGLFISIKCCYIKLNKCMLSMPDVKNKYLSLIHCLIKLNLLSTAHCPLEMVRVLPITEFVVANLRD